MGAPRVAKLGRRGDPAFCSLAAGPSGSPRSCGCSSLGAREGAAGGQGQGYRPAAAAELCLAQLSPRLRAASRGGMGLGRAQPLRSSPRGGQSRLGARALCIKPSSPAKVEEVGLPPGWEAEGSPAAVVFLQREWVAGTGGGVRPPTPGRALRRENRAGNPAHSSQPQHRTHPQASFLGAAESRAILSFRGPGRSTWYPSGRISGGRTRSPARLCFLRSTCPQRGRDGRAGAGALGPRLPRGAAGPLGLRR